MKRVTFITTGQPTTNPRLVKEAETLIGLGYKVKVICCFYQAWAQKFDKEITGKNSGMYIYCGGGPVVGKAVYYKTRLRQKLSQLLFKYIKTCGVAENAISRTHAEALAAAKKIKSDIYIAHNLGALPAAVMAAKYANAKVGYDAEDVYAGQFITNNDIMFLLDKYIEEKYFGHTDYFTAASPLIAEYYERSYPYLKPIVINNIFPKTNIKISQNPGTKPLKLFWFSQTVGPGRGIDDVIKAMAIAGHNIQLHLLGSCSANDKLLLLAIAEKQGLNNEQLHFNDPVAADELFSFAGRFDIGMATETASTLNRDVCLTNKIFTYIQSGLAVIASDTQAQKKFIEQYPSTGTLYTKNDVQALAGCLTAYVNDPIWLQQTKLYNYQLGQDILNWETESRTFIATIENTLAD